MCGHQYLTTLHVLVTGEGYEAGRQWTGRYYFAECNLPIVCKVQERAGLRAAGGHGMHDLVPEKSLVSLEIKHTTRQRFLNMFHADCKASTQLMLRPNHKARSNTTAWPLG